MFLVNSRLTRFSATVRGLEGKLLHFGRHPFFRSYGIILPSSLTKTHSRALGYSPRLRVSVYGTDGLLTHYEAFLGSLLRATLWANALVIRSRPCERVDLPALSAYPLKPAHPIAGWPFTTASPLS